jgi:hypothetical protein
MEGTLTTCNVGDRIKALDSVGKWCLARVVEINTERNHAHVHFLGWSKSVLNLDFYASLHKFLIFPSAPMFFVDFFLLFYHYGVFILQEVR